MFAGAKGGGSSSFKQTPDNLRSNDTFEGVLGLAIGPIKGPVRGLKSIKVDGTAIENETGQLNFQNFTATMADGDPLKFPQTVQLKLGAGAAPTQVGLSLPNEGGGNPIWITKTLNNTNADFVDLRFVVQQLFRQDAKGIYAATATLEIQMKPVGSTQWINPTIGTPSATYNEQGGSKADLYRQFIPREYYDTNGNYNAGSPNFVINGKTTSAAVYELRIGLPNEGAYADTAWDIRVRLLERESYIGGKDNADQEKRTIAWESMAAVYGTTMGTHEDWRGVSWLQVYGKASDQLTGVPEVTGVYDTKIVSVPAANIYNPETRQYSAGVWDGSWTKAFSTDPAWVISDAISDELSGISLIAPGSYLNKWDALELSKHCSELVPDGDGGTHPRYNMNIAIATPQKAEEFVRYLAGAVGALAWDQGDGEWRVKVDKADAPSDIFTLDNIENEFIYSHTDVDTRFNDIIGQFKNEEMDYRQDSVQLFDNPSIALIGRKPTTIALVGCTNRQEAMRRVKLRLRSTVNENRIVTFTTNRRGRNIEQLSTILIADGDLGDVDKRTTGRTVAVAADRKSIAVRDAMYLAPGVGYKMWFTVPNPTYGQSTTDPNRNKPTISISRNVTNSAAQRGAVTTLYLDEALPDTIADNLSVALEAPNLPTMPRLFRVTSVVPQDDGERIAISAINIDVGKWAASDNVTKQDTVFTDLRGAVPAPMVVPGSTLLSLYRVPLEQGSQVNLQASWVRPPGAFLNGFRIQYSVNGGALQTAVERQQTATWELPNAGPGMYHVEVCAMDRRGGYSPPLVGELEVTQALIDATQVKYTGGETLEAYKPRQPGADVTGANTAADTNNVAGRPAVDVIHDVDQTKTDVQTNKNAIDKLQSDTSADLTSVRQDIAKNRTDIAQAKTDLADAKTQLDGEIAQTKTDLQASVDATNREVAQTKSDLTAARTSLQGSIDATNQQVTQAKSDISSTRSDLAAEVQRAKDDTAAIRTVTTQMQSDISGNTSHIQTEETNRANADSALSDRSSSLEAQVNGTKDSWLAARIRDEATASANRDSAIAGRTSTLETNYTSVRNDLNNWNNDRINEITAANGRITSEALASSNRDAALASRSDTIEATFTKSQRGNLPPDFGGGDADWARTTVGGGSSWVYYEDTRSKTDWSKTDGTVITGVHQANGYLYLFSRQAPIPVSAGDVVRLYASVGAYGTCPTKLYFDCRDRDGNVMPNSVDAGTMSVPIGYQNDRAGINQYETLAVDFTVPAGVSFVIPVLNSNAGPDFSGPLFVRWLRFERSNGSAKNSASILDEATTRATADGALANRASTLEAQISGAQDSWVAARIRDEATASANRDSALSNRTSTLEAQFNGSQDSTLAARIRDEATARTNADSALADRASKLETSALPAGNLLPMTDFAANRYPGWTFYGGSNMDQVGVNNPTTEWTPIGENVLGWHQNSGSGEVGLSSGGMFISPRVPVAPGQIIQASAALAAHRASVEVALTVYDAGGGEITTLYTGERTGGPGGHAPNDFNRIGFVAYTVPGGAASVALRVGKWSTRSGEADSWIWMWRPYIGYARAGQTEWNPYSHGSAGQSVNSAYAAITDEATARSSADGALAGRANTLEAQMRGDQDSTLAARVRDEATARSNADGALANRASTLETNFSQLTPTWRVCAAGNGADPSRRGNAGVFAPDGTRYGSYSRSYTVVLFETSTNVVINVDAYDVYGSADARAAMAQRLNTVPEGMSVVVYTADEPKAGRLDNGLADAMARVGAGEKFFGEPFRSWSAYILIGRGGIGRGGGTEYYADGGIDNSYNSWLDQNFTIVKGRVSSLGTGGAATTMRAALTDEATTRAGADGALASRASTLEAQMNGSSGSNLLSRITDEATARTNADSAIAGRVSTIETSSRSSNNFVPNSDFVDLTGWTMTYNGLNANPPSVNFDGYWAPKGGTVLEVVKYGVPPSGSFMEVQSPLFPVTPSSFIQFYGRTANHRGRAWVSLFFRDADGNDAGYAGENYGARINEGGKDLNKWDYTGLPSIQVPSNAVSAIYVYRLYEYSGGDNPVAWLFQPYVGNAVQGQTSWNPYSPGPSRNAQVVTNTRITDEATARSTADASLAQRASTLESNYNSVRTDLGNWNNDRYQDFLRVDARVANEESTRAGADSALASRASNLEAQMNATSGSNLLSRITDEASTRASQDSALAGRASTLETTMKKRAMSLMASTMFDPTQWTNDEASNEPIPFTPGDGHFITNGEQIVVFATNPGENIPLASMTYIKPIIGRTYRATWKVRYWSGQNGQGSTAYLHPGFIARRADGSVTYYNDNLTFDRLSGDYINYDNLSYTFTPTEALQWARPRIHLNNYTGNNNAARFMVSGCVVEDITDTVSTNARVTDEVTARSNADSALANRASTLETNFSRLPAVWTARAGGNASGRDAGVWSPDGTRYGNYSRSYTVVVFDSNNNVIAANPYDVYGNGQAREDMANFLNGITEGQSLIVYTADEPKVGRLDNGNLQNAMARVGAGEKWFGEPFRFHSAYILMGRAGIGRGGGTEYYADGGADTNRGSWLEQTFNLRAGQITLGSGGVGVTNRAAITDEATARSNADGALASRASTLEAQMNGNSGSNLLSRITDEAATRASQDSALATRTSTLEARATGASNLLQNTNFPNGTMFGWEAVNMGSDFSVNNAGDNWHPINENALGWHRYSGEDGGRQGFWTGGGFQSAMVPIIGGRWYQFYAFMAAHRAAVEMTCAWYDSDGNGIGNGFYTGGLRVSDGGKRLGNWTQVGHTGVQAPSNAASCRIQLCKWGTDSGQGDSYCWFTHPMVAEVRPNTSEFVPYAPGDSRYASEALINSESTARANADGALSSRIDTVSATANGASSNASIALSAAQDAQSRLGQARVVLKADAGNGRAQFSLYSDSYGNNGADLVGDLRILGQNGGYSLELASQRGFFMRNAQGQAFIELGIF